jgi:predicted O-methyltransferase YrrM
MYSRVTIARKYLQYFITAANGKGHGIHSPFVFDFVRNILNDHRPIPLEGDIEILRKLLLSDKRRIEIDDFGAGGRSGIKRFRTIRDIASGSAKSRKLGKLLSRLVSHYHCRTIIELGTSLGISMAYLSSSNMQANCFTLEGSAALAEVARTNLANLGLSSVKVLKGNFDEMLPQLLSGELAGKEIDLAFIDGNHRLIPTLHYFNLIKPSISKQGLIIFDDIHWSREMEIAWQKIKTDPQVRLSIDLFFLGIVFFRDELKIKQDFEIRF